MKPPRNAYVIGSGPNGLTAAILLARAGIETTVLEAQPTFGGGARSAELTLPGFVHDICSAVHPLALSSPILQTFPLADYGLEWIQPPAPVAHPIDRENAVIGDRSVEKTADRLGADAKIYRRILEPLVAAWPELMEDLLAPLHPPNHPFLMAHFGLLAPWPASTIARLCFRQREARALFAGMAAHSLLPLEKLGSAAFGWVLTLSAHAAGWPIPRGGSQMVSNALAGYLESLGGHLITNQCVSSLKEVSDRDLILCDITPRQLLRIAGDRMPANYRRRLERYRYGPGVFKMDWALDGPIPWSVPDCARTATVHIGGTLDEVAASERAPWTGKVCERPFVLLAQPSLFDPSRAPEGKHTAWAYCHVPNGSSQDMSERIEVQIERFAPGFRARILARHGMNTSEMERHNANLIGGDINGGAQDLRQLFTRPTASTYRTPIPGVYLCSASTPPGGGVHGMCGYHAVRAVLQDAGM